MIIGHMGMGRYGPGFKLGPKKSILLILKIDIPICGLSLENADP